jgi:hypothetical protein
MTLLVGAYVWSWIVAGAIMAISFSILLVHVRRGNKNTWLTVVSSQLICSSIGAIMLGYGAYEVYIRPPADTWHILVGTVGIFLEYS